MLEKAKANKSLLIAFVISLACMFIAMFFLESANLSIDKILLFDIYAIKEVLFSANFWLFTLFFCIANSIFLYLFASKSQASSIAASLLSSALAFLSAYFLFPSLKQFVVIIPFYLIGLVICEEILKTRLNELKRFKTIRSVSAGLSKMLLLTGLGLFIAGVIAVLPQQEQYAEKFEQTFIKSFMRLGLQSSTEAVVNNQRYLILEIIESNEFKAMESANCEENKNFARYMHDMAQQIHSAKYREDAMKEVSKMLDDEEFLTKASEHVPFRALTRQLSFVLLPINAVLLFWLFGQIFIKTICICIATLLIKMQWS